MDDVLEDLKRYKADAMRSQDTGRQIVYTRAVDEIARLRSELDLYKAVVMNVCLVLGYPDHGLELGTVERGPQS